MPKNADQADSAAFSADTPLEEIQQLRDQVDRLERERAAGAGAIESTHERFENSPIPMTYEDWSEAKEIVDQLCGAGVASISQYVRDHPHVLLELAPAAKVVDVNPAAVRMYRASSKEELFRAFNEPPNIDTYNPTTGLSDIYVTLIDWFHAGETRVELEGEL